jgi:hypothetical protein
MMQQMTTGDFPPGFPGGWAVLALNNKSPKKRKKALERCRFLVRIVRSLRVQEIIYKMRMSERVKSKAIIHIISNEKRNMDSFLSSQIIKSII